MLAKKEVAFINLYIEEGEVEGGMCIEQLSPTRFKCLESGFIGSDYMIYWGDEFDAVPNENGQYLFKTLYPNENIVHLCFSLGMFLYSGDTEDRPVSEAQLIESLTPEQKIQKIVQQTGGCIENDGFFFEEIMRLHAPAEKIDTLLETIRQEYPGLNLRNSVVCKSGKPCPLVGEKFEADEKNKEIQPVVNQSTDEEETITFLPVAVLEKSRNSIMVIFPYKIEGIWAFDDKTTGLVREPFVGEVNLFLDKLTAHIPNAEEKFRMLFSVKPFPGYGMRLKWVREELQGNWYACSELGMQEGWLCPALFMYLDAAPAELYVKAEPIFSQC